MIGQRDSILRSVVSYLLYSAAVCVLAAGVWVATSYYEAQAFKRVTGKTVSTWDAMFLDLRVQETIK